MRRSTIGRNEMASRTQIGEIDVIKAFKPVSKSLAAICIRRRLPSQGELENAL